MNDTQTVDVFDNYILLLAAVFRLAITDAYYGKRSARLFLRDCAPWTDSTKRHNVTPADLTKARRRRTCA